MYSVSTFQTVVSQRKHGKANSCFIESSPHIWIRFEHSGMASSGVAISTVHTMRSIWLDPMPMMARSDSIHSNEPGSMTVRQMDGMISGESSILLLQKCILGGIRSLAHEIAMWDGGSMPGGGVIIYFTELAISSISRIRWVQIIVL
jgi:hypothetical protein